MMLSHEDIIKVYQILKRKGWIVDKVVVKKKRPWRIA